MKRDTSRRRAILRVVRSKASHVTADLVYGEVKREMPSISLGTVYRNLRQLVEAGEISEFEFNGSPHRYDKRTDIHGHFLCERCGKVTDLERPEGLRIAERIKQENGFKVSGYQFVLIGLCTNCQKESLGNIKQTNAR